MISYHTEIDFSLTDKEGIVNWLSDAISNECYKEGELNYIFCNDNYLQELNVKYLNHNTLTDIITFNYNIGEEISSDIFISTERVRENAKIYNVEFNEELHRVMIHGILHLCGYNDKTESEKKVMREKEDYYLSLRTF